MKLTLIEIMMILTILSIVSIVLVDAVTSCYNRDEAVTTYTDCVKSGRDDCVFEWN